MFSGVICQTSTPFVSVVSEEKPKASPALPPLGATAVSEAVLKRRAYQRQWCRDHPDKVQSYYPGRYTKQKERLATPEGKAKWREYRKKWRHENPEREREYNKAWTKNHRAERRRTNLAYHYRHHDKVLAAQRARRPGPTTESRAYHRKWEREHPDRTRLYQERRALPMRLRTRIRYAFQQKLNKRPGQTEALIGCTIAEAKAHIEAQFVNGMSWANRSSFVIDHHVPVAAFNLRDPEEAAQAFCWRNLRPITQHENQHKAAKLPSPLPSWLPAHIAARIKERAGHSAGPQLGTKDRKGS